ncbi:MAG: type II toxin-antitoxin system VapC family toxin [Tannerella sp.]|jgi:tRNA(fMet)-specific endonuclease VapC|nr:type II toxin-antitoxin system VapC family toxin [Tannerella sp.]
MKYLLDTNICVFFFRGKYDMLNILKNKGYKNCYISEITVAELRYGAEKSASPTKQHALIDAFLKRIHVLHLYDSILEYARIKVQLEREGTPIHDDFDVLIGATAVHNSMTLVTDNIKHFANFDGLTVENWIQRT